VKRWLKLGLTVPVIAAMAGSSWAWATDNTPTHTRGSNTGLAAAAPAAAVDTAVESKYTPITPCRIVDTRRGGGGRLKNGTTRAYKTTGTTGFAPQGGHSGGCGIPTSATAVETTVTAVNASGKGWLKLYPGTATIPTATFMNYTNAFNANGSAALTISAAATTGDFRVTNFAKTTDIVIDIQGYYEKPLWAFINADGVLLKGSRVTAVTRAGTGDYLVAFDRDISNCSYITTPDDSIFTMGAFEAPIEGTSGTNVNKRVEIHIMKDDDYVDSDFSFSLTVTC